MAPTNLKQSLSDWTDIDIAQYRLAVSLGLMPDGAWHAGAKGVFWTDNPMGNALAAILDTLTDANVLEKRDEPDFQYRWNPDFTGSWEEANR
jgi:hypothetical protein